MTIYQLQEREAAEIDWRNIGRASGNTGDEALEQFCQHRGLTEGIFRLKGTHDLEFSWTYRTLLGGRMTKGRDRR